MGLYRRKWRKGKKIVTGRTWWASFIIDGHQHCESTHTSNKRLARKILDIRRTQIVEGQVPELLKSQTPTLKHCLSQYLASRTDLHPNTRTRYAVSMRSLQDFFGSTRLPNITGERIEDFKVARLGQGTGPAGINRDLSLLRLVLKQAKRQRYIRQNPLADREHFLNEQKQRLEARPFSLEEEHRLLAVARGYLRPLLVLLLDSGLRPSAEALPLKWADVDFERTMIRVVSSKTRAGVRTIPMTTRVKAELLHWRELTAQISEFVFFHPKNPSRHLLHVPKTWARALKDANVPKRRLYDCRASYCSRAYAAGIQPVLIELLMGHAGSGLVHAYAKADDDFKRDAAAKLEAFVASKTPSENTSTTSTTWVN